MRLAYKKRQQQIVLWKRHKWEYRERLIAGPGIILHWVQVPAPPSSSVSVSPWVSYLTLYVLVSSSLNDMDPPLCIIQNTCTVLKILWVLPVDSFSQPLTTTYHLTILTAFTLDLRWCIHHLFGFLKDFDFFLLQEKSD